MRSEVATRVRIGTAGWSIPRQDSEEFPAEGSALERYARILAVTEVNSSFYRQHRAATWKRWADSVPSAFRFSVKVPKTITHQAKLADCSELLGEFLGEVSALGAKLAVLLVQLPPKLEFDCKVVEPFFLELRNRSTARIACEPRNPTWFSSRADALLQEHEVARVAADPAICEAAATPGGWRQLHYWRLHGSPVLYRSSYSDRICRYADLVCTSAADADESWCIFDNTASSAAIGNALALLRSTGC